MDQYLSIISSEHLEKLTNLAKTHNSTPQTAIRNIINHMQECETDAGIRYALKQLITARQIEQFIDTIT